MPPQQVESFYFPQIHASISFIVPSLQQTDRNRWIIIPTNVPATNCCCMRNDIPTYLWMSHGIHQHFTASPVLFAGNSFFISFIPCNVYICTGTSMVLALSACFSDTLPATEETEDTNMTAIAVNAAFLCLGHGIWIAIII